MSEGRNGEFLNLWRGLIRDLDPFNPGSIGAYFLSYQKLRSEYADVFLDVATWDKIRG